MCQAWAQPLRGGGRRRAGGALGRWPAAVLLAALLAVLTPRGARGWGTEISATVSIFRLQELTGTEWVNGKQASRCEHLVDNAGRFGSTKINFILTHFFVDRNLDFVPEYYCFKPGANETCVAFTPTDAEAWRAALVPCLGYAVSRGLSIAITPHLDDGLYAGQWRNAMAINPLARYDGRMSYAEIMLLPLADALSAVITADMRVWFALQGEMSLMVMRFPDEHRQLLPFLKSRVLGSNTAWAGNVRMGVSQNYNKQCGMRECSPADVANTALFRPAAVQALFSALDFVGLSGYPRFYDKLAEMEDATTMFSHELAMFGINLQKLVNLDGKELIFSEFGIGGGVTGAGNVPASTAEEAASYPYFGVFGPYTRRLDPWRQHLPQNVLVATKQHLQRWYAAAALWLSRKGGPTWRVDHVFLWNLASWDVLGVHMQSTNKEGSYRDDTVAALVRAHNLATRDLSDLDNPGSFPPY